MSPERRSRIAEVIRKHRLLLIEDDPYSFLTPGSEPIAAAIPEHTYLAASLSKCIAPGLRTSIVVAPDKAAVAQLASLFRATLQMPAPLMAAVAVRWMRDGTARNIVEAIRTEAVARQTLAREALAGQAYASQPNGHHIWLPLSADWPAQRFAAHLHGRGIAVVTGEAFATDATPQNAIRLALGAARGRAQLSKALEILSAALSAGAPEQHVV
jgi:DNA-binding transcriptional MocR family regulator